MRKAKGFKTRRKEAVKLYQTGKRTEAYTEWRKLAADRIIWREEKRKASLVKNGKV